MRGALSTTQAPASAGLETLIVDGVELPVSRLRKSETIDLSKHNLFTMPGHDEKGVRVPFRALSVYLVGRLLRSNGKVTRLDLCHNEPCHFSSTVLDVACAGFGAVCDILIDPHNRLRSLQLAYCRLTDAAAERLSSALRDASMRLEELGLRGNAIGEEGMRTLANALRKNVTLVHFDIADNLDHAGSPDACSALRVMLESQKSLRDLQITGPGSHSGEFFADWAGTAGCSSVESLTLVGKGESRMDTGQLVVQALKGNEKLKSLSVISHGLEASDLDAIMDELANNKTLTMLDFSNNKIDTNMGPFVDRLRTRKPPLKKIALGGNPCIANMTAQGKQRYTFDLSRSNIDLDLSAE